MNEAFEHLSVWLARQLGKPLAFFIALTIVAICHVAALVPAWQSSVLLWLGAETGNIGVLTTLLLLGGQLREAAATQAKLDEGIFANDKARNELIGLEERSADEIAALRQRRSP